MLTALKITAAAIIAVLAAIGLLVLVGCIVAFVAGLLRRPEADRGNASLSPPAPEAES